jgi:hypothetical protein
MVLYSAGAGQEALDRLGSQDNDPNGLFTRILIKEIRKPGVPANQVLKNVSYQVVQLAKSVNHDQVPALYDQTIGDYFFVPPGHAAPPPAAASATASTIHVQTSDELEQSFWDRIRESTDPQDYADYKKQFPQGAHAGEAALQLRRLKRAAAPKSTAPVARSAELAGGAAAPPAEVPAAMPAAATSAAARAGSAAPVSAGTYPGYTTSSLNPGMVQRGRMVLASNGDFEYTGATGVKVRGSLNLSRPQQIEGAGTVTQPKRFGIPLLHYPDGSTTANMVIRGEIVNGTLRGRYSDAYETGELIFDLNSPM